jgi:hypothetical protein
MIYFKKLAVLLVSALFLVGCESISGSDSNTADAPGGNSKGCFVFSCKIYTSISPSISGYPKTEYRTIEECDMTESEARDLANSYPFKDQIKIKSGNHTVTTTTTTTYKRK